jgi:hypothetical protein
MLTANSKSETAAELQAIPSMPMPSQTHKPLTAPEKAFWKDAFIACAKSTLPGKRLAPDQDASICADFADAAMDAYRSRIIWRKP